MTRSPLYLIRSLPQRFLSCLISIIHVLVRIDAGRSTIAPIIFFLPSHPHIMPPAQLPAAPHVPSLPGSLAFALGFSPNCRPHLLSTSVPGHFSLSLHTTPHIYPHKLDTFMCKIISTSVCDWRPLSPADISYWHSLLCPHVPFIVP